MQKFAFDREFAADGTILREGDTFKRVFTEEELQMAAEQAAMAAQEEAEVQAAENAAAAARQLAGSAAAIIGRLRAESEAMRQDAARLALATAKAIAGAALERYSEDTLRECVAEALSDLRHEPRIAVRIAPQLTEHLTEPLEAEARLAGLEDALVVRADPDMPVGDCILEWRSGAIERTAADIETRIEQAVTNWLAHPDDEDELEHPQQAAGGQPLG